MNQSVSEGSVVVRKRRQLSPEDKYQVFLEASRGEVPIAEVLRQWAVHSSELQRIRQTVQPGALKEFRSRKSRKPLVSAAAVAQWRAEKVRLEQTLIEQSVELMRLKKKRAWGRSGGLRGQRWPAELKGQVLAAIDPAVTQGLPALRACERLGLPRARDYAWKERVVAGALTDRPAGPAPGTAEHRLREEEKEAIAALLREEPYADRSIPPLAIVASEAEKVQASASSFYRQAYQQKILRTRQVKRPVKKGEKPRLHPTGPHQGWSWDLRYLPFFGRFW